MATYVYAYKQVSNVASLSSTQKRAIVTVGAPPVDVSQSSPSYISYSGKYYQLVSIAPEKVTSDMYTSRVTSQPTVEERNWADTTSGEPVNELRPVTSPTGTPLVYEENVSIVHPVVDTVPIPTPVTVNTPTGGYIPLSVKEGVAPATTVNPNVSPDYTKAVQEVQNAAAGTVISKAPVTTQPSYEHNFFNAPLTVAAADIPKTFDAIKYTPTVIPVYKEPVPGSSGGTGGYVPLTIKELDRQTAQVTISLDTINTTGGYVPMGAPKAGEQVTPYEKYIGELSKIQQAPRGAIIGSSTPIIISQVSPSKQEYEKFSKLSPIEKYVKILGTASHNPIDFFGETPKFIYSTLTSDKEKSQQGYWDNFLYKEIERMNLVKSPLDRILYSVESPFTQAALFAGGTYTAGYMKGLGGAAKTVATNVERALGGYFTTEIVKGGAESYQSGNLSSYLYRTGLTIGLTAGLGIGYAQKGELAGFRKYELSKLMTPEAKAQLQTQFKAADIAVDLSSKGAKVFDPATVLGKEQGLRFAEAMTDIKAQKITASLQGSGSLGTFIELTKPVHDIDIGIKQSIKIRSPISSEFKLQKPVEYVSDIPRVESIFKDYGLDMSKFDIHDIARVGSEFNTRGIGFAETPIRTPKGSVFDYQMRLSELNLRSIKETIAPEHTLRGKDWVRAIDVATQKYNKPGLTETLSKYKPELKEGTYEMIGPSYYQRYPFEAPKSEFTFFERIIRKYGEPLTTKDLYREIPSSADFMKAEPFRPQFISEGMKTPDWAKGVKFYSSMIPAGVKGTKYDSLFPSLGAGVIRVNYSSTLQTKTMSIIPASKTPTYPSGYTKDFSTILSGGTSFYTPDIYKPTMPIRSYPPSIPSIDYTSSYPSTKTPYTPGYTPSTPYTPTYTPPKYTPTPPYIPSAPTYTPPYTPSTPTIPYTPSTPKQGYTPYTPYTPTYTPPPTEITPRIPDYSGRGREKTHEPGYNVYIKDRSYVEGKKKYRERWVKANSTPLTEGAAMSLGATAVDQSAAASFRITQSEGKPGLLKIGVEPWNILSSKFYHKKGTYIESTQSRIDSTGEIQGISALGWIANQRRAYTPSMPTTRMPIVKPLRIDYGTPQATRTTKTMYTLPNIDKILRGVGM